MNGPDCNPLNVRRSMNDKYRTPPKNWFVISNLTPTGAQRVATNLLTSTGVNAPAGLPPGWALDPTGFAVDIPKGYMLWDLKIDYPNASGWVMLGVNNPPFIIRTSTVPWFNLDTSEYPCDIIGPNKILIGATAGNDVNFMAIVAEL